ncbi:MAG: Hsp70 family protein [Parachlamydiales bacterium]|nr:Hsp70 family protein [Parachlamydiales bacterium]
MTDDKSRYIIGIDLGTTNCSVSYVDTDISKNPSLSPKPLGILQLTALGVCQQKFILPSFCYLALKEELPKNSFKLPWFDQEGTDAVGSIAKELGAMTPSHCVQSAKSWLSHSGCDRQEKILPLDGQFQISPVEATSKYLSHIVQSWNATIGKSTDEFEEQEVIVTVPASFDEVARLLTVEAAKNAGFKKLTLLEEPQAAFYSWLMDHEKVFAQTMKAGQTILVCDVGGGTTDFSLINVNLDASQTLTFERMAVGDHLLLGGDNMDLAVAHFLEQKLDKKLSAKQWGQLIFESRKAKEELLTGINEQYSFSIQGDGAQLIKNSLSASISKVEVQNLLMNGFFAHVDWKDAIKPPKNNALKSMGLPYEEEPSIITQMAYFLGRAFKNTSFTIDYVLFNGGTMKPPSFRQAVIDAIAKWCDGISPKELPCHSLDTAVSRGAAYYGKVRRGLGVRIGGGIPCCYYVAVQTETGLKALTLLKRGAQEGTKHQISKEFLLQPNEPIRFMLYQSHTRLNDEVEQLIDVNEKEMYPLAPIETVLRYGSKEKGRLPVNIEVALTEVGVLEINLKAINAPHKWALNFQIRKQSGDQTLADQGKLKDETYSTQQLQDSQSWLKNIFINSHISDIKNVMPLLEQQIGQPRSAWSLTVSRNLVDVLLPLKPELKSDESKKRFWNLLGFCMRPGFGFPLDDWRMKEIWKVILSEGIPIKLDDTGLQKLIAFRRFSGGLSKGHQTQLALPLLQQLKEEMVKKTVNENTIGEILRCLSSFERIDTPHKVRISCAILNRFKQNKAGSADYWSLGRLGARHLIYGTVAHVVPPTICQGWIDQILKCAPLNDRTILLLGQMARMTDQRTSNLPDETINKVLAFCAPHEKNVIIKDILTSVREFSIVEKERAFGESLPIGLILAE